MRHYLFLVASARANGNTEQLARVAAETLPAEAQQTWLNLRDYPLPTLEDLRHTTGEYPLPAGHARTLLDATLSATDIVFVSPVYWYSVSAPLKRYLDEWSAWLRVPGLNFRAQMGGKRFWVIANSTGTAEQAEPMFGTLRLCANFCGAQVAGTLLGNGSKPGETVQKPEALAAAKAFFEIGLENG